jgi:nucleoside-diphosphate-sugar epimerase
LVSCAPGHRAQYGGVTGKGQPHRTASQKTMQSEELHAALKRPGGWWRGRRVLVTGGAGFIGSNLAARLLSEGAMVSVVDNLERGRREYLGKCLADVEFYEADLRDAEAARKACIGVEAVFHLASKVGGIRFYLEQPGEVFRQNVLIDQNVWSAALAGRVPLLFYASSAHVYPSHLQSSPNALPIREEQAVPANPKLSYGWAKLVGEKMMQFSVLQGCPTRAAIARIIGAYGPNQDLDLATGSAIPVFCRRAIEYPDDGPFLVLGTGAETRSYHFVTDTVEAMLRAVQKLEDTPLVGPFNLGSEDRISIAHLVKEIVAISGKEVEAQWDHSYPTAIWGQVLDCSLANRLLDGWRPLVPLREGLRCCYHHIAARVAADTAEACHPTKRLGR